MASSASLDSQQEKVLISFRIFGASRDRFEIIEGVSSPAPEIPASAVPLPLEPFIFLSNAAPNITADILRETAGKIDKRDHTDPIDFFRLLEKLHLEPRLLNACMADNKTRAVSLSEFTKRMFGGDADKEKIKASRGLFIARSLIDEYKNEIEQNNIRMQLPSFRMHYFFRNIEGLWASTKPLAGASDNRPAGELYSSSCICDSRNERRVLEMLYCEHCGTVFFGGNRLRLGQGLIEMLATTPDIEGIPERQAARFVERRTYDEFAIFWPAGNQTYFDPARWRQPTLDGSQKPWANWVKASLNTRTGHVELSHEKSDENPADWVKGYLFDVQLGHGDQGANNWALPCVCPSCGEDHTRRKRISPVRGFRTGFTKVSQIFTKELLPASREEISKRKLVVFQTVGRCRRNIQWSGKKSLHGTGGEIVCDELRMQVYGRRNCWMTSSIAAIRCMIILRNI